MPKYKPGSEEDNNRKTFDGHRIPHESPAYRAAHARMIAWINSGKDNPDPEFTANEYGNTGGMSTDFNGFDPA